MKIRLYPLRRLAREHLAAWSEMQLSHAQYNSPYFRPEFHQIAAEVGRPVMVGVIEQGDRPVGFFPFEKSSFGTAMPVGLRLSDFHGVIVAEGIEWSAQKLLQACGLRRFVFNHLPINQQSFITGACIIEPSPVIDVRRGFPFYQQEMRTRGEKELQRTMKKREKCERELGPLQFCYHDPRPEVIDACFAWKSSQYERTGALNVLRSPWVPDFLRRIARWDTPHFAGSVSTLYWNDELVAVHVGMRSATVLHHWFPAHDPDHPCVRYSPGKQLLVGMIEGAGSSGMSRIDLGKGDYDYKRQFATGASEVAEGICGGGSWERTVSHSVKGARQWLRRTAETTGFTSPIRWYRHMRDWLVMR